MSWETRFFGRSELRAFAGCARLDGIDVNPVQLEDRDGNGRPVGGAYGANVADKIQHNHKLAELWTEWNQE